MTEIPTPAARARELRREARALLNQGDAGDALACLDRALLANPDDALTLCDRGLALAAMHDFASAMSAYDCALLLQPDLVAALINRGQLRAQLGSHAAALSDLDAALRLRADSAEALLNRGNVLCELGRHDDALASFDQALAAQPRLTLAYGNRAKLLLDAGRLDEALAGFERALEIDPEDGEALFGHASALLRLDTRLEEAAEQFARAACRGVPPQEAQIARAAAFARLQRHREASECLIELLATAPTWEYALGGLVHSLQQAAAWDELSARIAQLAQALSRGEKVSFPYPLLSSLDDPELQLRCARSVTADKFVPVEPPLPSAISRPHRQGPIRVAYLSADFREHPVAHLFAGVLERHERREFELIGVSIRPPEDQPIARRLRSAFDHFIDVSVRTDREAAAMLRSLDIDIAVDLAGYTEGMRLGILAHRVAPVQVNYLGYAGTLGAPYMDYLIADDIVVPEGAERWYSEKVARLPGCYLPNDNRREIGAVPTRAAAGLPESGLVLCAFTSAYKILPEIFAVWMRLLQAVPEAVLWLRSMGPAVDAQLRREARGQGVNPVRLIHAPRVPRIEEHLARQALADLYLDTMPYNAHSTACEALWAGVPVLTCAGRSFCSRVAASALMSAGLPELITHGLDEYEARARELLCGNRRGLAVLRARCETARLHSALFDTATYTRHLEAAYRHMWTRSRRALPPESFRVASTRRSDSPDRL